MICLSQLAEGKDCDAPFAIEIETSAVTDILTETKTDKTS